MSLPDRLSFLYQLSYTTNLHASTHLSSVQVSFLHTQTPTTPHSSTRNSPTHNALHHTPLHTSPLPSTHNTSHNNHHHTPGQYTTPYTTPHTTPPPHHTSHYTPTPPQTYPIQLHLTSPHHNKAIIFYFSCLFLVWFSLA